MRQPNILRLGLMLACCASLCFEASLAHAIDTSNEEAECLDIGFKKKTSAFANCVLELVDRRGVSKPTASSSQTASHGQDADDATCKKYGFKPKTDNYAICRQQIDLARQQAQQQQAHYAQQRAEYEAQLAAQQKESDRRKNMAMLQMGLGLLSGQYNSSNNYGATPQAPVPPVNQSRTYVLPGGKMMNCNTNGSVTTCF